MTLASTVQAPSARAKAAGGGTRRYVFGLDVESSIAVESAFAGGGGNGAPRTTLEVVAPDVLVQAWRPAEAVPVIERRYPSGRIAFSLYRHAELGYRLSVRGHGRHLISSDGSRILSVLPRVPQWRRQRFLYAQLLPLASTLRGFELFHASGVALRGQAIGFVAGSGTGKTSVAAHLIARGASFITDDVMALEARAGEVLVHPGPGVAGIHAAELRSMTPQGRSRLGSVVRRADKVYVTLQPVERPLPLAALYYLERTGEVGSFSISENRPPDPRLPLSSSFVWYLAAPEHLLRHLDACARIAESVRLFSVRIPPTIPAFKAAELVEDHALTVLA
jgi:hypothetical protein